MLHRAARDVTLRLLLLIGSASLITLSLWCVATDVVEYRGLSGIDSALFAYAAVALARDAVAAKRYSVVGFAGLLLTGFLIKIDYELATGHCLFVDSRAGGFTPLPIVHMVGASVGLVSRCGLMIAGRRAEFSGQSHVVQPTRSGCRAQTGESLICFRCSRRAITTR